MNEVFIVEELNKWLINFVEVPNKLLNDWPPCPFARQSRLNNKIVVKCVGIEEIQQQVKEATKLLEDKDVVILCFDHNQIDPVYIQEYVSQANKDLLKNNYIILEDHPNAVEYVNGLKMNFGYCGLLLIQQLDKLNDASELLKEKDYYKVWSNNEYNNVVSWRTL